VQKSAGAGALLEEVRIGHLGLGLAPREIDAAASRWLVGVVVDVAGVLRVRDLPGRAEAAVERLGGVDVRLLFVLAHSVLPSG
jgi:hypothetical protein